MSAAGTPETPADLRLAARSGQWRHETTGVCPGYVQANLVVLPAGLADEFEDLCAANPRPLPLLERTPVGVPDRLGAAPGADLRSDLPGYHCYEHGELVGEHPDVRERWPDDAVGFLLGCSFSAERALREAGVWLKHLELGQAVPMYVTNRRLDASGRFGGDLVVSMRSVRSDQVDRACSVTERYPAAHGAPVQVGDPAALGIGDLDQPDWGHPLPVDHDEVPVFWACGVTPKTVITSSRPAWAITHEPGHMFVTDIADDWAAGVAAADVLARWQDSHAAS